MVRTSTNEQIEERKKKTIKLYYLILYMRTCKHWHLHAYQSFSKPKSFDSIAHLVFSFIIAVAVADVVSVCVREILLITFFTGTFCKIYLFIYFNCRVFWLSSSVEKSLYLLQHLFCANDPECATRKVCSKNMRLRQARMRTKFSITFSTHSVYLLNHELCFLMQS